MVADVMTFLSGKNFLWFETKLDCFLVIIDTLMHHLILDWVCEASQTCALPRGFSPVSITCHDRLIFVEVILQFMSKMKV
jgi:hypothetical protein